MSNHNRDDSESVSFAAKFWLIEKIRDEHPEWVEEDGSCPKCIDYYRQLYGLLDKED